MQNILLEQLTNSDIDLLKRISSQQEITPNTVLIEQKQAVDFFYIILEGKLVSTISINRDNALARAFAALEGDKDIEKEIVRFSKGEVIGEIAFLEKRNSETTIKAAEKSIILKIPRQQLIEKLKLNQEFAAHFYRAIAILLSNRFERLIKLYLRSGRGQIQPLEGIPLIFGELSDSDIDWMVQTGNVERISTGTVLVQTGRRIESLYILLEGNISLYVSEQKSRLVNIFASLEKDEETDDETPRRKISQISRGETIGEIALLDSKLSKSTYIAAQDSLLLALPLQQVLMRLERDPGAAARFYRVLTILISGRIESLINRLGFGKSSYRGNKGLSEDIKYEDEIDLEVMDNITLGGIRFSWMLDRLKLG